MTTATPMSSEAKSLLSKTIRDLRGRLLQDLGEAIRSDYKLGIAEPKKAKLGRAAAVRRERLDAWVDEQIRALSGKEAKPAGKDRGPFVERFRLDVVKQAAYTLINRLVYLRLLEAVGLREVAVLTGGWQSPGYRDFRELAPELVGDDSEGYELLLRVVFDELALDLPGLFGRHSLAEMVRIPHETLRYVVEQLDRKELASCWTDDMTLGWVYQYWNDPEREALDAKLNDGGKVERHEIASKTQMFTERYMVDWLLQNSLGPMWLAMCKKRRWAPLCEQDGTLARLEARRVDWRAKRDAGEVSLTELMPLYDDEERRWAYYVPQPIPEDAVEKAPASVWDIKLLDPAVGSGHFLVVAFDLLVGLYREEAQHRRVEWSEQEIVESILANNLHGIDLDPRAVQIAAAGLWLKAQQVAKGARPQAMNLVASQLRLAGLAKDDPARVELREAVERETGIPGALTDEVVEALEGADYLGSLLKVGDALEQAITKHRARRSTPRQGDLLGGGFGAAQLEVEFDEADAKARLTKQLEGFLGRHTGSADLGLRLRGEQLAAGVRFLRVVKEGQYDLVVGNPPYQGTSKMADAGYVQERYTRGKADLYATFLERGLELAREGGTSTLLTMRSWMFTKQFAALRKWLVKGFDLRSLGDFAVGAFDDVPNDLLSVAVSSFRRASQCDVPSVAFQPTATTDASYDRARTARKRAATSCQVGTRVFDVRKLAVVPEWPLVYWWPDAILRSYQGRELVGQRCPARFGVTTGDNDRFVRFSWEPSHETATRECFRNWAPLIHGAKGETWFDSQAYTIKWRRLGIEVKIKSEWQYGTVSKQVRNEDLFFARGLAFTAIGNSFAVRAHRRPSVFSNTGLSLFPEDAEQTLCALNSKQTRTIAGDLAPGLRFDVGDVNRLPLDYPPRKEALIVWKTLETAFSEHESHREPSVEFLTPGPSPWGHAQEWAQLAVDRPENTPLPAYQEQLDPGPNTNHTSFALGVALGRFHAFELTAKQGILAPTQDALTHALPDGTLFLDGTLEPDVLADSLAHPACTLLHTVWSTHRPQETKRSSIREYLRLDFFDVHKKMYENRPIHWPLSSEKKTFVAWINLHRWHAATLRNLLANHLNPTKQRIEGQLADLRAARDSGDAKASRKAEKELDRLNKALAELTQFIADVSECAERGPTSADPKQPKTDAAYNPDLDNGVMVNSSALHPLLTPQWKDPKKWWKELCTAKGRKDYDWSHLAAKYFPKRVDEKCQLDPSLAVAHGCFWKYHPARAYAWELRLQDEIEPDFTLDEAGSDEARAKFLAEHADEADEARRKELKRRERKGAKAQTELGLDDDSDSDSDSDEDEAEAEEPEDRDDD